MKPTTLPDLVLRNGRITTLDPQHPEATSLAIKDGRIVGVDDAEGWEQGPKPRVIDLQGRRVIPGLNDSHLHVIRAGLYYNLELRWDGVPSLAEALRRLKDQAQRTPPPHWVRVIGGWNEWQFAEKRMPTLEELTCPEEEIRQIESMLTICDGKITHAAADLTELSPSLPPVSPGWSPVGRYGGYENAPPVSHSHTPVFGADGRLWEMGCGCAI
jgi:predicted amidohydrolase YtcJ